MLGLASLIPAVSRPRQACKFKTKLELYGKTCLKRNNNNKNQNFLSLQ